MPARIFVILTFILISSNSFAAISASPSPNADGNFTVTWDSLSADWYELKQQFNGGGWITYTVSGTSKAFFSKAQGTYTYKLNRCNSLGHPDEWECFDSGYGTTGVAVQPLPWPEPPDEEQAFYEYEARIGDINGDSRIDILVDRTTVAEAGNGTLDVVLLTHQFGGSFTSKVPSSTEFGIASNWPIASIDLHLSDVNIDGFLDVVLTNIDSHIDGALDQIVYASGSILVEEPQALKSMDSEFTEFLSQVSDWAVSETYFDDNALWVPGESGYWGNWQWVCYGGWGDPWGWDCGWEPVWVPPTPGYWSYDHFNQDAYELSELFGGAAVNMFIPEGSNTGIILENLFERIFNSGIFKGILSGGGIAPWEIDVPIGDLGSDRGFTFGVTILDISDEVVERGDCRELELGEEVLGIQNGLGPALFFDRVEICLRKWMGLLKMGTYDMITPNGRIYVNPNSGEWEEDYSLLQEDILQSEAFRKAMFIHEMVHLRQYYIEGCRPTAIIGCRFKWANKLSHYKYTIVPGQDYFDYQSTEHRAEMVNDRWMLTHLSYNKILRLPSQNSGHEFQELDAIIPFSMVP